MYRQERAAAGIAQEALLFKLAEDLPGCGQAKCMDRPSAPQHTWGLHCIIRAHMSCCLSSQVYMCHDAMASSSSGTPLI